jgi:hypothetical protein
MHPLRVQLSLRTLLVALAVAAALFALGTRSRDEFAFVAIIAAGMFVFFIRRPNVTVQKPSHAILIAIDHIRKLDVTFRPEKHMARAYRQSVLTSWIVDFYASGGAHVVKRVKISGKGSIRSLTVFAEDEQIASLTESSPIFILARDGSVVDRSYQCDA